MADKIALPKTKFSKELTAGSTEPAMKAAEATTAKLYKVPVTAIKPIPGFNVRVESPDYLAHIDMLKKSITANGYDATKPLAGFVAKEGDENVIYVTDGHSRLRAVTELNEESETPIKTLPVLVQPKEVSLTDLTVALHTANSGRPLTPFELGVVVKRLMADEGAKKADIATRLGVTSRYLDDVLLLANADKDVKQHVASGAVSSTMAIGLLRKDADSAGEKIAEAVNKAAKTGKKATKKHTAPKMVKLKQTIPFDALDDMKELVKQAAGVIRESIPNEEGEDDTKSASVTGSITIIVEVPADEDEPAPKKVKKATKKPAKKQSVEKPSKKNGGVGGAKVKAEEPAEEKAEPEKPAKKAKKPAEAPAVRNKKANKAKKATSLGIEGAEPVDEDDEIVKLPPKVKSDDNVEEEVDI